MNSSLLFSPVLLPQADLINAFLRANFGGQLLVVILALGSVVAWSIMITKFSEYRRALRASTRFLAAYEAESQPLALLARAPDCAGSPLYALYRASCHALAGVLQARGLDPNAWFQPGGRPEPVLTPADLRHVQNRMNQALDEQVLFLEQYVIVLVTAVSLAPFLGLMGTVWGVMDSFGGMAVQGSATMSAVAPGVSGSLITTLIGLFVAVPSLVGYNFLVRRMRVLTTLMDHFAERLTADLEDHCLRR